MRKIIVVLITVVMMFSIFSIYTVSNAADDTIQWADFSNATFGIEKETNGGYTNYNYIINNVKINDDSININYLITDSAEKQVMTKNDLSSEKWHSLNIKDGKGKISYTIMGEYLEQTKDYYLTIYEMKYQNGERFFHEVVSGKKIDKINIPNTPEAFANTLLSHDTSMININAPIGKESVRKMSVKIGKITDNSILNSIKNQDADCFSKLLSYSKSSDSIYSEILNSTEPFMLSYIKTAVKNRIAGVNERDGLIDLYSVIQDDTYYYLYVTVDDENGKYRPVEAVTLAYSVKNTKSQDWFLFFYGNEKFKWQEFNNGTTIPTTPKSAPDVTVAPTILPKTGINAAIIAGTLGVATLTIVLKKKYNNYKDI